MTSIRDVEFTPGKARETFAVLSWREVRMISFDRDWLEVLLKDNRRVRVPLATSEEAYAILAEIRKDGGEEKGKRS
jgi:hypothetical protein